MWSRRQGEPRVKNASKLYVQPSEVAGKLVKEMEEDKVARGSHVSVRNRYTVYLCREDYERWRRQEEQLVDKLEMHLNRHMRSKGYEAPGAIDVKLLPDPDLKLGNYGIYAEREMPSGVVRKGIAGSSAASAGVPGRAAAGAAGAAGAGAALAGRVPGGSGLASAGPAGMEAARAAAARAAAARQTEALSVPDSGAAPVEAGVDAEADEAPPSRVSVRPERPATAQLSPEPVVRPAVPPRAQQAAGVTQVISADDVAELGLAKQTIVLRANNQDYEFNKGRVIVGRSRDVDFRIDNADVSRRHAAFFWSEGNIMVKDLGSTNGTMVNGYPVDTSIVHPGDVVLVGDCFITVESR
jgi:hypothetical protein